MSNLCHWKLNIENNFFKSSHLGQCHMPHKFFIESKPRWSKILNFFGIHTYFMKQCPISLDKYTQVEDEVWFRGSNSNLKTYTQGEDEVGFRGSNLNLKTP